MIAISKGKDQNTHLRTAGVVLACHNFFISLSPFWKAFNSISQFLWSRSSIFTMAVMLQIPRPEYLAWDLVQKWSNAPIPGQKLATKVSKPYAIPLYVPGINTPGWPLISA